MSRSINGQLNVILNATAFSEAFSLFMHFAINLGTNKEFLIVSMDFSKQRKQIQLATTISAADVN